MSIIIRTTVLGEQLIKAFGNEFVHQIDESGYSHSGILMKSGSGSGYRRLKMPVWITNEGHEIDITLTKVEEFSDDPEMLPKTNTLMNMSIKVNRDQIFFLSPSACSIKMPHSLGVRHVEKNTPLAEIIELPKEIQTSIESWDYKHREGLLFGIPEKGLEKIKTLVFDLPE